MQNYYLLLILIITTNFYSFSENNVKIAREENWVEIKNYASEIDANSESSNGIIYLISDEQYNTKNKISYYHYAYKILSQEGVENSSEISINFDPTYQKLIFHSVDIIRNKNRINKLSQKDIKIIQRESSLERKIYDGSIDAIIILEDTRLGDVVEYKYSIIGINPIFNNKFHTKSYLQWNTPINELFIKVISPKNTPLYYNTIGTSLNIKTETKIVGENKEYTWYGNNLPATQTEAETPSWYTVYPYITISEYKDWKEVHNWALNIFKSVDTDLGKEFNSRIDKWKNISKDVALDSILYFVKDEIRYLGFESGINSIKPTPCKEVLSRRFGDCKDKSLLLSSALRKLGVNAFPALVNSNLLSEVKKIQPNPSAFNHCVVYAVYNNKSYWFDPTMTLQRGGFYNMYMPKYKTALVMADDMNYFFDIYQDIRCNIDIQEEFSSSTFNGTTTLFVNTMYEGPEADNMRQFLKSNTKDDIKKSYQDFYASRYPNITMIQNVEYTDNESANIIYTTEKYEIKDFWTSDTLKKKNLVATLYPISFSQKFSFTSYASRKYPLTLEYPLHIRHKITANLPEVWSLIPSDNKIVNQYFKYSESAVCQDNVIEAVFDFETFTDHIKAVDYKKIYAESAPIQNNIGYTLTKSIESLNPNHNNFPVNWLMVILAFIFIGIIAFILYKLYHYNPNSEVEQEHNKTLSGWIYLLPISLGYTIIGIIILLIELSKTYFNSTIWNNLTNVDSVVYNPFLAFLIVMEMLGNIFLFEGAILLLILFFKRRTSFPILMFYYIIIRLVFISLDTILAFYTTSTSVDQNSWVELLKIAIYAAIWLPILKLSSTIKETFVVRLS